MFKTLIEPSTLAAKLGDPDWIVIDCRFDLTNPEKGEELYREAHIPGAKYAHLDRHLSGTKTGKNGRHPLPDSDVMIRNFSDLGISPGMQVIAYDADSGMYASTMRRRCSTAASRGGSVKAIRRAAAWNPPHPATSRARRVPAGA